MSGGLLFKRDPTEISDEERDRLRAEMDRLKSIDHRRQLRAVVAVVAAVSSALVVAAVTFAIIVMAMHASLKGVVYLSFAPALGVGGWVYRRLYPLDFWGRS